MTEQNIFEENNKFSIPEVIPILPLHNVLVFPKTMIPLEVSGSAAQLIDEAMIKDRLVGLIMTKKEPDNQSGIYTLEDLHHVGTCAAITENGQDVRKQNPDAFAGNQPFYDSGTA